MSFTHRNSVSYQSTGIGSQNVPYTQTADTEANYSGDVTTADNVTFEVIINTPIASSYKSMFLLSSGSATIKFLDQDSVGNNCTIALTAGIPLIWSADHVEVNPAIATGAGGTPANRETVSVATGGVSVTITATILADAPAA